MCGSVSLTLLRCLVHDCLDRFQGHRCVAEAKCKMQSEIKYGTIECFD